MAQQPDAFQETGGKVVKFLAHNRKQLASGLIFLTVLGVAFFGYDRWLDQKETNALDAITKVEIELQKKRQEVEGEGKEDVAGKPNPEKFAENYGVLSDQLEQVILAHKGRNAAMISAIRLAGFYLAHEQFDRAEKLLTEFESQQGGPLLQSLLQFQAATVQMSKEQWEQAVIGFEQLLEQRESEFLHPEALLRSGICYEKMKQIERAREAYMRAATEFADSNAGKQAKTYLRLLELEG